jgi:hypothetical protein
VVLVISGHFSRKDLQRVTTRQPGVFCQINLTHSARTQQVHDPEASKKFTVTQRHNG